METKLIARVNNVDIIATKSENQLIPIKPICTALGIDVDGQRKRIERDEILSSVTVVMTATGSDDKSYGMTCLPIEFIFGWLFSIDTSRVNDEAKEYVIAYKKECYHALFKYFAEPQIFLKQKQELIEKKVETYQECQRQFKNAQKLMNDSKNELNQVMKCTIDDWRANNRQMIIEFEEQNSTNNN